MIDVEAIGEHMKTTNEKPNALVFALVLCTIAPMTPMEVMNSYAEKWPMLFGMASNMTNVKLKGFTKAAKGYAETAIDLFTPPMMEQLMSTAYDDLKEHEVTKKLLHHMVEKGEFFSTKVDPIFMQEKWNEHRRMAHSFSALLLISNLKELLNIEDMFAGNWRSEKMLALLDNMLYLSAEPVTENELRVSKIEWDVVEGLIDDWRARFVMEQEQQPEQVVAPAVQIDVPAPAVLHVGPSNANNMSRFWNTPSGCGRFWSLLDQIGQHNFNFDFYLSGDERHDYALTSILPNAIAEVSNWEPDFSFEGFTTLQLGSCSLFVAAAASALRSYNGPLSLDVRSFIQPFIQNAGSFNSELDKLVAEDFHLQLEKGAGKFLEGTEQLAKQKNYQGNSWAKLAPSKWLSVSDVAVAFGLLYIEMTFTMSGNSEPKGNKVLVGYEQEKETSSDGKRKLDDKEQWSLNLNFVSYADGVLPPLAVVYSNFIVPEATKDKRAKGKGKLNDILDTAQGHSAFIVFRLKEDIHTHR